MCAALCMEVSAMGEMSNRKSEALVKTEHLSVRFPLKRESPFSKRRYVNAVSDVSIEIFKGEAFALVGESGCGKTTLADATLGFAAPSAGEVFFNGEKLDIRNKKRLKQQRRSMQKIFQDPASSMNPRFTVARAVAEPLMIRRELGEKRILSKTAEAIESVGLSSGDLDRFVSEFSGGQQQRIAIARALVSGAEYIVCDEPVSALDVSVHAQILNLLMDIQKERGITYMFISHNLASVRKFADRLAIMYLGRIVEYGDAEKVFANPMHPYTRMLIDSVLSLDGGKTAINAPPEANEALQEEQGLYASNDGGCGFRRRCPIGRSECESIKCSLEKVESDHYTECPYAANR
ncbi:MAG: ABC transporter ATP-binding protein [Clostridia bacterium]|nr:ABC transporter ATP-binding protein [Clostridia bacterium]